MSTKKTTPEEISEIADKIKGLEDKEKLAKVNDRHEAEAAGEEVEPEPLRHWDLEGLFGDLYMTEPFLGSVSSGITKVADSKQPTAYVGVRPNGKSHEIIMGYNPKFLREIATKAKRQGVIKHELFHIILQHIFTRSVGEKTYAQLWNWATDMAINSLIGEDNLPEMCLIPGKSPIDPKTGKPVEGQYADYIANAPKNESSDYYFEGLRRIQDEMGDGDGEIAAGSGIGTMDGHGNWHDVPEEVQNEIKDKVRGLIEKGAMRAEQTTNWGTMPSEMVDYIRSMISKEIDWRSILRNFIGRTRTLERNSTIRKINKKMPYIYPGVKRPFRANFACFIDQSGSMSDDDIAMLFSEMQGLAGLTEIDVYHFDTEIDEDSHKVWSRTKPFPKPMRTRCGGTDFQAVADFCNKHENRGKWSGVIILTDGYAPKMGAINGAKTMWVITETGTMSAVREGDLAVQMSKEKKFREY